MRDVLGSSQLIRALMGEIAGQHHLEQRFSEMYALIIKAQPDFRNALTDEDVFTVFAPPQLKNATSELFQKLKKQALAGKQRAQDQDVMRVMQHDVQVSKVISEKLTEILCEDARFNGMLVGYLTDSTDYRQVVSPYLREIKSIKNLHLEHLEMAYSQIQPTGSATPKRIAELMAVHVDQDFQALQTNIAKMYHDSQKLDGEAITLFLYDLIKKRCPFDQFTTLLSQNSMDGPVEMQFSHQFLLSYLLNNSDTYLRTMILMACSSFMPLPLVSYQPVNIPDNLKNHAEKSGGGGMMMQN